MEQDSSDVAGARSLAREEPLRVGCSGCGRIRSADPALAVCPACEAMQPTLRSLEMSGSHPLSDEAIDDAMKRTSPGNYALGYMDGDAFVVFYVGRSDSDVKARLHEWVGMPSRYDRFASASKAPWATRLGGLMPVGRPALGRVTGSGSSYTRFAYSYAPSAEAAFQKESRNYDDFGGSHELDNEAAPSRQVALERSDPA